MTMARRVTSPASMATPSSPYLGLLNSATLMPMHKQRKGRRPEEENRIHNPKRKRRLQHRAGLINIQTQRIIALATNIPKRTQGDVERSTGELRAVCICNPAELVDTCYEGTYEAEVDEGDEDGGAFCGGVTD